MLNKVLLMGRLTKDPEVKYTTTNNTLVSNFTLAVNRKFTKQGEEKQTDFLQIIAWSKLGEFCSKYLTKGTQVVVCGRIQTRTWDDNENKRHYVTEIVADEVHFADSKKGEATENKSSSTAQGEDFFTIVNDDDLPF